MPRPKKVESQVRPEIVQALARHIAGARKGLTQDALGEWLGKPGPPVSQPTISRILGTIAEPPRPYPSLGKKLAAKLADKFDETLESLASNGTLRAGGPYTDHMIPHRGEALSFLAGPEYPPDLIMALRQHPVPLGAETWTRAKWAEHFVSVKKAWQDGVIALPGMRRRKP